MFLAVVCLLLSIEPPFIDPINGEILERSTLLTLPSGHHLGWQADHQFPSIINVQPGDGGLSRFDRLTISAHGRSVTQLRLVLNSLDITDPARAGTALIEIPEGIWDTLTHRSLWTSQPGFAWQITTTQENRQRYSANVIVGRELGGSTWIPKNFMDREPATDSGAPSARRGLDDVRAAQIYAATQKTFIAVDYARDTRVYPQTYIDENDSKLLAIGERTTVIGAHTLNIYLIPITILAAWQLYKNDGEGSQYRWPQALTANQDDNALILQLTSSTDFSDWQITGGYSFGYRKGDFTRTSQHPTISDLEGEWLWMARPQPDESLSRWRNDFTIKAEHHKDADSFLLRANASYATLNSLAKQPSQLTAFTYNRASNGDRSAYIDIYDPANNAKEWFAQTRAELTYIHKASNYQFEGLLGLDYSAVGTGSSMLLGTIAPAVGVLMRFAVGDGELFALVRREPDYLTEQVSAFLDPSRPSGRRYRWIDNGDGIPTANETGALAYRFGGAYNRKANNLSRPSSNQFACGWITPIAQFLRLTLTGAARLHTNRYTVKYDDKTLAQFTAATLSPQGEGPYYPGIGMPIIKNVYTRSGATGNENYILTNDQRPDFWLGTEIELATQNTNQWFFALSATGYWNAGAAPFGSFSDRNDPGIISYVSADPNAQINDYGRYDQDRSFSIKFLGGYHILENLLLSTALRYRDGEPFTAIEVLEGLPQGPVAVMTRRRGRIRHTFHMSLDLHAAYTHTLFSIDGLTMTLAADVMNVLGSGTEQLEEPRVGEHLRDPLEMVPGRTGYLSVTVGWK
ncbi:MAG: hypothetical protein JW841_09370 [Deltaproteobacteria bacterium]|nr:hypothetical protein [Deltaproteobacteria bacterium]